MNCARSLRTCQNQTSLLLKSNANQCVGSSSKKKELLPHSGQSSTLPHQKSSKNKAFVTSDLVTPGLSISTRNLHWLTNSRTNFSSFCSNVRKSRNRGQLLLNTSSCQQPVVDVNVNAISTTKNNPTEFPLLPKSNLTRGTCEIVSPSSSVIPVRSVVTSQKVAESGRAIMEEPKLMTKEEREEFMSVFPQLVRDLTEIPEYRDMPETNRWLARVLHYNVPHGKRNRGLATALAYRYLAKELTEENIRLSYVLGWCVEILQAYFLVADDIMDDSQTRRGRLCWYRVENLGAAALNDAIMLESTVYILIRKYFRNKDYYADLLDIMHEVNHKTIYGQSLDTSTGREKKLESYTMDRYSAIVKYKTSFYSFYLPIRLAMAMAGINDVDVVQQLRTVTLEMGHFFQVQDDYLDCFGDISITGKIGTDIQDCKCSWLFIMASQKCTPEQKQYLWENYGQNDLEKIDRVKKLYTDLQIPETYSLFEEQTYALICTHIKQMSAKLPKQLFYDIVNKIYRRNQ